MGELRIPRGRQAGRRCQRTEPATPGGCHAALRAIHAVASKLAGRQESYSLGAFGCCCCCAAWAAAPSGSRKLRKTSRPTAPLFSGWNCVAIHGVGMVRGLSWSGVVAQHCSGATSLQCMAATRMRRPRLGQRCPPPSPSTASLGAAHTPAWRRRCRAALPQQIRRRSRSWQAPTPRSAWLVRG